MSFLKKSIQEETFLYDEKDERETYKYIQVWLKKNDLHLIMCV